MGHGVHTSIFLAAVVALVATVAGVLPARGDEEMSHYQYSYGIHAPVKSPTVKLRCISGGVILGRSRGRLRHRTLLLANQRFLF